MYRLHCFLRGRINMIIESGQTFYAAKNGNSQPVPNTVWRSTELDFRIEKAGFYTVRLERDDNGEPTVQDNGVFLHLCTIHRSDNVPRSIGTDGFKPPRERTLWTPPPRPSGGSEKFINPSFEEATSANKFGWTIEQSHRFRADMPLHDHRALELESGSIVTQKVKLVKGVDYNFRCYLTEEGSLGLSVVRLDTLVAENNDEHVQSIGYGNWGYKQVTFKAIGTQHNFTAVANGATPTIIDYCTLYKAI
ncbi:hypothetical protein NDN08_007288 [Rhodosorus marinus]|uniref:CBM-cenC domain-containing protein n=1 Tax=Rhodosorus marinus TaxID=101924 RepID=A0AAV8UJB4_9RHOD|nr:hypothetical protein NDN08_007288 [Rhodosorus marinus]